MAMNEEIIKEEYQKYVSGIEYNKANIISGVSARLEQKHRNQSITPFNLRLAAALAIILCSVSILMHLALGNNITIYVYASDGTGYKLGEIPVTIENLNMDMSVYGEGDDYYEEIHRFDVLIDDKDIENVKYTILNNGEDSENIPDSEIQNAWFMQRRQITSEEFNDPYFHEKNPNAYQSTSPRDKVLHEGDKKPVYDVDYYIGSVLETNASTKDNHYNIEMIVRKTASGWTAPNMKILVEVRYNNGTIKKKIMKLDPTFDELPSETPYDTDDMPSYKLNISTENLGIIDLFN